MAEKWNKLLERAYYWYHRIAIGFYQDVLAYDMEGFFERRHLFDKKQKYGGDIPFIGPTKWHDRRHYRDWVKIETPKKWEMPEDSKDEEFVDFYLGGYVSEWNAFDIEEFDRGCIEFDFVFPEANKPEYINYDLTEHPYDKSKHLYNYRYPFLFPDPDNNPYESPTYRGQIKRTMKKVFWDVTTFTWFEILRLPKVNLNPKGWVRKWWDEARDVYKDEYEEDDDTWTGAATAWWTAGMFMIDTMDIWSDEYWDVFWIKGQLMFAVIFFGTIFDQAFAAFGWYTLMKDNLSLTRLRFGYFCYYELFMALFTSLGTPKYCSWFMHGTEYRTELNFRQLVYNGFKYYGWKAYKDYYKRFYVRQAWHRFYNIAQNASAWHQYVYEHWYQDLYMGRTVYNTWMTMRRLDVIYFNVELQRYPFFNTLDFRRPPMSHDLCGWIHDRRAIWIWGDGDYLLGSQYVIFMRISPKSRKWLGQNMTPLWFTLKRAIWLFEPTYYYDAAYDYQLGFQDPSTPIMEGIIDLHHDLFFFFVVIGGLVFWLLFKTVSAFSWEGFVAPSNFYRNITHHTTAEVVWTILPALILVIIATPSFSLLYAMEDIIKPSITIKVIGNQWYWSYEYFARAFFDGSDTNIEQNAQYKALLEETQVKPIEKTFDSYMIETNDLEFGELRLLEVDNRVIVPTFTHIRFLITSSDVLHSFAVPSLGVKLDACPGRLNQTTAFITREGLFYGQCSEICGINHAFMPIVVEAVDKGAMLEWLVK